jgi:hypothetical protein
MKKIAWPGHGYKFTCHRCGFQFPSTEIKKEWTGLYVCNKDYEARHPQTLIKIRGEQAFPSIVSKDSDVYVGICNVATSSAYADLGTADCMQAGNTTIPYNILKELFTNGH